MWEDARIALFARGSARCAAMPHAPHAAPPGCAAPPRRRAPPRPHGTGAGAPRRASAAAAAAAAPPRRTLCRGAPTRTPSASLADFEDFVLTSQAALCDSIAKLDGSGASFSIDAWERSGDSAGYGRTRVLSGGALLEKGAANVSVVRGTLSPARAAAMSARGRPGVDPAGGQKYSAVALSLVFHAASPYVPTLRGDVRAFAVEGCGGAWVGGGADLTPAYLFEDDAAAFHAHWAALCDAHAAPSDAHSKRALYASYKAACDAYFYIPARREHRGAGGIFFDDVATDAAVAPPLTPSAPAPVDAEAFARAVAGGWHASWAPICEARRGMLYGERQRNWQLQRRGRYLEFNLLYDRGVRFGLDGGRMESIMVSAPPLVRWDYAAEPPSDEERRLLDMVSAKPRDWVPMA
jgi:coproporphyrinogen III oxidase